MACSCSSYNFISHHNNVLLFWLLYFYAVLSNFIEKLLISGQNMVRHNNQLPDNLPQLQNLIKRDSESYKDEFEQQYRHFLSSLEVFALNPGEENKSLDELVMFIAQVTCRFNN